MRDEMMGAVVRRAIEHPEFREHLIEEPRAVLEAHGFSLESSEMEEIEQLGRRLDQKSPADVEKELLTLAARYGVEPGNKR